MTHSELRAAVDALPYTQREIAEKIGVSHGHLRNALNEASGISLGRSASMLLAALLLHSVNFI